MLIRIDDIHLYTNADEVDMRTNSSKAKKYLDSLGIDYTNLNYADDTQHQLVFDALRWWSFKNIEGSFFELTKFPFLTYTEVHDDLSPDNYPRVLLTTLKEIKAAGLADLYKLGREPK